MSWVSAAHGKSPACKARISARSRSRRSFTASRKLRLVCADLPSEHRPSILLVYRGKAVRQSLTAMLLRLGYEVTLCDDGRAAVQQLAAAHFDLVITGIVMPNMDGLELMRTLRSRHSRPLILAVADDSEKMSQIYLRMATLLGAASTQPYPVDPAALLADVQWLLRGRKDVIKEVVW